MHYQRKRVFDASLRRRKALAQQRRLVASELHDTVAADLVYAVMTAERLRIARSDDVDLVCELNAVIEPVRAAVGQLRRSLQSMTAADNGDVVLLSSVASPRPMEQVLADVRRVLEERDSVFDVKGVELLEGDGVFTPGTRQQVLRVINELVNNVAKYTIASGRALVAIEINDDVFECMVTNSAAANHSKDAVFSSGIGLEGARRRVETLGGDFVVNQDGGRWTVVFTVPLSSMWRDVPS
ncbi:sensor histidine kinase [Actinomyces sp.]|uniref:sensor histidine kinase n=1 Tax=Actinomyces sp. TaxID=29317 RepID=UPI0026DC1FF8|nr:histidine kinase [Actinomyces sp.]MDO4901066.1 histidine kinase [Actinomyces sp.]